ncbi:hypothetical protein EON81_24540 [bacterium]|nr:MAG: hypothetical protein EON81_24540 [bacterium]
MTLDEFNSFLGAVIAGALFLAAFNLFRARKKGPPAMRMAFASLMFAVAVGAYRQEGTFGTATIACIAVFLAALLMDALLRAKGAGK